MESSEIPPPPLSTIRILSLAQGLVGNSTAQLLAELGAEVVKVESLTRPDGNRRLLIPDHARIYEPSGTEVTAIFAALARSQLGLGLDILQPEGRAVFDQLLSVADVFLYNLSPAAAERLNVNWEKVSAIKKDLILLAISGYGSTGPNRHYLAYGGNISSFAGLMSTWGFNHGAHHDYLAAYHGVLAVLVALFQRGQTGEGAFIDLAQTEAGCAVMGPVLMAAHQGDDVQARENRMVPWAAFAAVLRCKGPDSWIAVEAADEGQWADLCAVMDHPELAGDVRFGNATLRAENYSELRESLETWTRARTAYQACLQLQKHGICAGAVQNTEDLYRDPQLWSQGYIRAVWHPDAGLLPHPGPTVHLAATPMRVRGPAPRLGQHTNQILRDWLNLSDSRIQDLGEQNITYDVTDRTS